MTDGLAVVDIHLAQERRARFEEASGHKPGFPLSSLTASRTDRLGLAWSGRETTFGETGSGWSAEEPESRAMLEEYVEASGNFTDTANV